MYKNSPSLNLYTPYNMINIYASEHQAGSLANIVDDYTGKKKNATINHERNYTSSSQQGG